MFSGSGGSASEEPEYNNVTGTSGVDNLQGTAAADALYGLAGDDVITGGGARIFTMVAQAMIVM